MYKYYIENAITKKWYYLQKKKKFMNNINQHLKLSLYYIDPCIDPIY